MTTEWIVISIRWIDADKLYRMTLKRYVAKEPVYKHIYSPVKHVENEKFYTLEN